jgi:aryl-alcohol dehydrogenase-like predicted oxidoreductase
MKYRPLGRTGMNVSEVRFGAWAIGGSWGEVDDAESMAALHKAVDEGVDLIDTANVLRGWAQRTAGGPAQA